MITFQNNIKIDKPAEEVFSFLADFENVPKWNYYVRSVRNLSDGEIGLSTVFHQIRRDDEQTYEITDYQPEKKLSVRTRPGSQLQFERTFTVKPSNGATELTDDWKLNTGRSGCGSGRWGSDTTGWGLRFSGRVPQNRGDDPSCAQNHD